MGLKGAGRTNVGNARGEFSLTGAGGKNARPLLAKLAVLEDGVGLLGPPGKLALLFKFPIGRPPPSFPFARHIPICAWNPGAKRLWADEIPGLGSHVMHQEMKKWGVLTAC